MFAQRSPTDPHPVASCVESGVRSTRSGSYILRMPQHRTAVFDKSFHLIVFRLWNALPQTITSIDSRSRFVAKLKDMYLERLAGAVPV
ncbi:hypothetical protein J6590_099737 [Homalodisca vitripennis]|nr:hypothetical protein J6590_099737 [Homalodisca vitripennis]